MNKKILMIVGLSSCLAQPIYADGWGATIGAIIGALFGHAIEQDISQQNRPVRYTPVVKRCHACTSKGGVGNRLKYVACGHRLCESCIRAKIDNANRFNADPYNVARGITKNPTCDCGKSIDYSAAEQREAMQMYENQSTQPSAPPVEILYNNISMCASQCNTPSEIVFPCGHGMCSSCLKSRARKAVKSSGNYAVVRCPQREKGKVCNCEIPAVRYIHLLG